jgi:hypothetical protein
MVENERQSLFGDLWREAAESWCAMSFAARMSFVAGLAGFVALNLFPALNWFPWNVIPDTALSALRVAFLMVLLAGAVANARVGDEFYQRVHLLACAYTLVAGCVIVYALSQFGMDLGSTTIAVFVAVWAVAVWAVAVVASFAVLRR